jgi:hypothetical protein
MSNQYNKENLEDDLNFLIVNGLVEVSIGKDGETRYKATEASTKLSEEELMQIIVKGLENT